MPAPPARKRSANVPCGTSSTSSSPDKYWRANSRFSPTYEPVVRRMRFACNNMPSPYSSTPQLLLTVTRSVAPERKTASIKTDGKPESPKPPTANEEPLATSATASSALANTLSITSPPLRHREHDVALSPGTVSRACLRRCWCRRQSRHDFIDDHRIAFSHKDIHGAIAWRHENMFHLHCRHHDERLPDVHGAAIRSE